MTGLQVPIVVVVHGEGGSGGALAIGVGDRVLALENAVYSVISPEGASSILWRSRDEARTAAAAMRMTAEEQRDLGVVDIVVAEPGEGAHADHRGTAKALKAAITAALHDLSGIETTELMARRYARLRSLGTLSRERGRVPQPAGDAVAAAPSRPHPASARRSASSALERGLAEQRRRRRRQREGRMTDRPDALDAIGLAADELIPQLAERLRTHGLAEIEVSRGELRLRVTAAADEDSAGDRRDGFRPGPRPPVAAASPRPTAQRYRAGSVGVASPAVGFFVYADGLGPGLAVTKGASLGHVEMLGVRHDVLAPRGGTVLHLVAESGEAVEYGQVVLELDPAGAPA